MGNLMHGMHYKMHPDTTPAYNTPAKHDPLFGFPEGREPKEMVATEEEMYAAKLPLDARDYCAHFALKLLECRRKNFPLLYKCHHAREEYFHCEYEEYIDQMKDYEREKRLMEREKRISSRG